jgi:hypothetical protein
MKVTNFGLLVIKNGRKYFIKTNMLEYFADPFILEESENKLVLIVERYSRISRLGSIYRLELIFHSDELIQINRKKLICENYHLSFPCIYKFNNRLFIVPETASANSLFLYEINEGGTKVLNKAKLADGLFVDPIFFKKSGELFLMWYTGIANNDGKNISCAIDKFPIDNEIIIKEVKECSTNRNAGRIIYPNFKLSQTSTGDYGNGMFMEEMNDFQTFDNYHNDIPIEEFLKYQYLFLNSHHLDILGRTIVLDISYKVNLFKKNKNVLANIGDFENETSIFYS